MMRRQLEDIRAAGEPVAALWASEGAIYGRFGYGIAARNAPPDRPPAGGAAGGAAPGGRARCGPGRPADHVEHMRAVYERVRGERPGMLDRPGPWWEARLHDPESDAQGRAAAAGRRRPRRLRALRRASDRDEEGPAGEVTIRELVAATPAAHALLWDFLLDQDLTRTITWCAGAGRRAAVADAHRPARGAPAPRRRPVGAPRRRRRPRSARAATPPTPTSCSSVADDFCPWNAGRYRLAGGRCEPTDAEPDLALDASALGAAYLGGTLLRRAGGGGPRHASCARARWPGRRRPSAPTSRRGARRSSEAVVRVALAALRGANSIIEGR